MPIGGERGNNAVHQGVRRSLRYWAWPSNSTRLRPPGWTVRPRSSGTTLGTVFGKYASTDNSTSQGPVTKPTRGSFAACRSVTAWAWVLPQKSSSPTGSSGRSKRQSQYRVTGALELVEMAWTVSIALPAWEVAAPGQAQTESLPVSSCSATAAHPARGSDGGQVVQGW